MRVDEGLFHLSVLSGLCVHSQRMREVPSAVCRPQYTRTVSELFPRVNLKRCWGDRKSCF